MPSDHGEPLNPVVSKGQRTKLQAFIAPKHPGSICVANYKGGVGKTTLVSLLGYYLAKGTDQKVLLFDVDPQCSLSLAMGFDPEEVTKTELTVYNLVKPSKWANIKKTNFLSYVTQVRDKFAPAGLHIIRGSFEVENLDLDIARSIAVDEEGSVPSSGVDCPA